MSLIYSVALLVSNPPWSAEKAVWVQHANQLALNPLVLLGVAAASVLAVFFERRLQNSADFALGLLIGEMTVLLTVVLNCAVLMLGSATNDISERATTFSALLLLIFHLPIAFVEGAILGFTMSFLVRVKPDILGISAVTSDCTLDCRPCPAALVTVECSRVEFESEAALQPAAPLSQNQPS